MTVTGVARHYLTMMEYDMLRRSEVRWVHAKWVASFSDASAPPPSRQRPSLPPFLITALSIYAVTFVIFVILSLFLSRPFLRSFFWGSNQDMVMWTILRINKSSPALLPGLLICVGLSIDCFVRIAIFARYTIRMLPTLRTPYSRSDAQSERWDGDLSVF